MACSEERRAVTTDLSLQTASTESAERAPWAATEQLAHGLWSGCCHESVAPLARQTCRLIRDSSPVLYSGAAK